MGKKMPKDRSQYSPNLALSKRGGCLPIPPQPIALIEQYLAVFLVSLIPDYLHVISTDALITKNGT